MPLFTGPERQFWCREFSGRGEPRWLRDSRGRLAGTCRLLQGFGRLVDCNAAVELFAPHDRVFYVHVHFVLVADPAHGVYKTQWWEKRWRQRRAVFTRIIECTTEFSAFGCILSVDGLWFAEKKHDRPMSKTMEGFTIFF